MNKVIFAHQLRGIAAMMVVISHLMGVFWGMRETVAAWTFSPVLEGWIPTSVGIAFLPFPSFGPLGVGLFYLISGFVISFSIQRANPLSFLTSRAFRIYPLYWACSLISLTVLYFSAQYWNKPFNVDTGSFLSNMLLVHNYFSIPSFDLINTTLAIEIKFYLLAALLTPWLRKAQLWPVFAVALVALTMNAEFDLIASSITSSLPQLNVVNQLAIELQYVCFMFTGTLFYYHFSGKISTAKLIASVLLQLGIFTLLWKEGQQANQFPVVTNNYLFAAILFAAVYSLRRFFRPIKPLDWLADISYPLYILHSLVGYSLIKILMDNSLSYEWSLGLSLAMIFMLAYISHIFVEMPANRIGKALGNCFGMKTREVSEKRAEVAS